MRGLLSLDQELRAIRKPKRRESAAWTNQPAELKETERPWQPEVEQLQHTMREVLRAVAGFSGVELPGLPAESQDNKTPLPGLDLNTLKDRFRNDLEGFSLKTTQELASRAREQTRVALEAVQNEVGGMVDKVAAEFRENQQLPAQIEKLLEPCVEDAESRLSNSISQKFEHLVADHERLVQEKLQETVSSVHTQIAALEQSVQQLRDLRAEAAAQPSAEQPSTAEVVGRMDALAAEVREKLQRQSQNEMLLEPRIEKVAARLEKSIAEKVERLVAQHEQLMQAKLQETLSSVHAQMNTLEQTVQEVRALKSEQAARASAEPQRAEVQGLLAEHDRMVQARLQEALSPVQTQMNLLDRAVQEVRSLKSETVVQPEAEGPSTAEVAGRIEQLAAEVRERLQDQAQLERLLEPRVGEAAARLEESIAQRVDQLAARQEQLVQAKLQGTLSSVQDQINALEHAVQQMRLPKAEPLAQLPAEQLLAAPENAPQEVECSLDNGLKSFLDQSFSRIETSFHNLREARKAQSAPNSNASMEYLRKAIPTGSHDMLVRVQQALDNLDRLGTKEPQPAS